MKKLLLLLSIFAIFLSCSSDETSTPVTPPPAPIVKYTITLSAGEGGTVSSTGGEYEAGQTVSVTATPQGEYLFKDWSDGNTNATRTITVSSNSTLTANFEKKKYPLTVNIDGEGEVLEEIVNSGRTTDYNSGTTVKLTAVPAEGWVFVGWTGAIESTELEIQLLVSEAKTVSATFSYNPPFVSKAPRYSAINETTSNFYNQFYFESYMTRDTHEALRDFNFQISRDLWQLQENDAVYYDFDKNGSLDLFGFQFWSDKDGEWGTRPGRYYLIKDYSWGKREKVFYHTQVSFTSGLDLADLDGDNQLEVINYSYNVHQNAPTAYNSSLPEMPVEVIKISESLNFTSSFLSDPITSHDSASGDIDNDGDVDILLFGLVDSNNFGVGYYNNKELLYPHFLINDGSMNFELSKVFINDNFNQIWGDESYNQFRTTFYDLVDINGDNHLDIVESYRITSKEIFANDPGRGLNIYWGDGSGKFDFNNKLKVYPDNSEGYQITSLGATYLDYDLDGDLDIFLIGTRAEVGNYVQNGGVIDTGTNFYQNYIIFAFKNNGETFKDVTNDIFDKSRDLSKTNFSHFMDINARDVDGDGDFDLVPAKTSGWFIFDQLNNLYWENQGGFFSIREEGGYNNSIFKNN